MSPRQPEFLPASAAPIFAALSDVTRLHLLSGMQDGTPRSIAQLAEVLPLTRQGVSKHLRVLERAGMVRKERVGRESRFVIDPAGLAEAKTYLEQASRQWDESTARLKALITARPQPRARSQS